MHLKLRGTGSPGRFSKERDPSPCFCLKKVTFSSGEELVERAETPEAGDGVGSPVGKMKAL